MTQFLTQREPEPPKAATPPQNGQKPLEAPGRVWMGKLCGWVNAPDCGGSQAPLRGVWANCSGWYGVGPAKPRVRWRGQAVRKLTHPNYSWPPHPLRLREHEYTFEGLSYGVWLRAMEVKP